MGVDYPELDGHVRDLIGRFGEEAPDTMEGFRRLHEAASASGELEKKTKELIALAIGVAVRCDGCIAFHTKEALEAGASREEIIEAIGVAILMGGGPAMVYGVEAMEALEQFERERVPA